MKHIVTFAVAAACILLTSPPAPAQMLMDFNFNEAVGTAIEDAINEINTNRFDVDTDLVDVTMSGAGILRAYLKTNTQFGTTYVDLPSITSGVVHAVIICGWAFDTNTLDVAENEEIRISLITNDPRGTFVTGELYIERLDINKVSLHGNAVGTGAVDTPPVELPMTQLTPFVGILSCDLDTDTLYIRYSIDGGASFTNITPNGTLDPDRGVESLRLVLNNDLSQDSVQIDRVYAFWTESPSMAPLNLRFENDASAYVELTGFPFRNYSIEYTFADQLVPQMWTHGLTASSDSTGRVSVSINPAKGPENWIFRSLGPHD